MSMKRILALAALLSGLVQSQAVTVLYDTDTGSHSHGIYDTFGATHRIYDTQSFVTDNSGLTLGSVSVGYYNNNFSVTFSPLVQILADNSNSPNLSSVVATLSYSSSTTGSIVDNGGGSITAPAINGDFRLIFSASGGALALSPNTKYWIAAGGSKTGGDGIAAVGYRDFDATASGAWYADQPLSNSDITSSSHRTYDGSSFSANPSVLMQVEISSGLSAVPEPGEYAAAFGLGLAGFAAWRRRRQALSVA